MELSSTKNICVASTHYSENTKAAAFVLKTGRICLKIHPIAGKAQLAGNG